MTESSETQLHAVGVLTKAEAAYQELRKRILSGSLAPGATINQERLAADLGLSITPLREALRRLEAEDLVTLSAHKIVRPRCRRRHPHELFVTRERLDPLAAELAASEATGQEAQAIADLAAQQRGTDLRGRLAAHRRFHLAIYAASHNRVLAGILGELWTGPTATESSCCATASSMTAPGPSTGRSPRRSAAWQTTVADSLMRHHVEQALRSVERIAKVEAGS